MKLLTNAEAAARLNMDERKFKRTVVNHPEYTALIKLSPRIWRHDEEKLEEFIRLKARTK